MRVLLDECLPQRLRHELPGHEVVSAANDIDALRPMMPLALRTLSSIQPKQVQYVGNP
jgi:hypothetical protein